MLEAKSVGSPSAERLRVRDTVRITVLKPFSQPRGKNTQAHKPKTNPSSEK
jgi:hypothetical protein